MRSQWFLQFLKDLGRPQVWEVTVEQARAMQVKGQELFPVTKLPAQVDERTIPVGPRGNVQIRILRPEGATGILPVVMYFHGGGWVLGDAGTYDRFLRDITNATRRGRGVCGISPVTGREFSASAGRMLRSSKVGGGARGRNQR